MTTVTITLASGQTMAVAYSWSFGEMAITAILLAFLMLWCLRWIFDLIVSVRGKA